MGNDEAIESKIDTWFADEMKLVVLREESSPKNGEIRIELTDLRPGEPDPALFRLPAGYTVRDHTPAPSPAVAAAAHAAPVVDMAHLPTLTYDAALAQLSDPTPLTRATAAAVLVKMATDDTDLQQKDKVAYELARKKMNLDDARKLAQQAVDGAEKMSASSAAAPPAHRPGLERTLARAWDTLGYIYGRQGDAELERRYLLSAWTLDPLAYYGSHLGRAYENAGQSAQASEIYAEALTGRGSDEMKQTIRDRLSAFTTPGSAAPAGMPVENSPAADAVGVLDIELGAKAPAQASFVSGDDALKPIASELGGEIAAMWPVPDDGPERILRRVSVTCVAGRKPACHAQPVGSR